MAKDLFGTEYDPSGAPGFTPELRQEYLKEILRYDPATEEWTWLVTKGGRPKGTVAGFRYHGHWQIRIDRKWYRASHLLCLCVSGKWPSELDKIASESDMPSKKKLRREAKRKYMILRKEYQMEYRSWSAMRNRVLNDSHEWYHCYEGRGITICERWLNSFENFVADMGKKPAPHYTLERIENDGNYEPNNCKWSTMAEQMKNRGDGKRKQRIAKLWG